MRVMEGLWPVAWVNSAMGEVEPASEGKRLGFGGKGGNG